MKKKLILYRSSWKLNKIKRNRIDFRSVTFHMWHAWERGEKRTGFWWESPKKTDHLKDIGVDGGMGLEWI
jgi:hypothetical protein